MSHVITFVASDDKLTQAAIEAHSLDEATLQIPDGAYTVFPIFEGGKVAFLDRHFARLDMTIELLDIASRYDHQMLRDVVCECAKLAGFPMTRLRLTLPRSEPQSVYISLEAWHPLDDAFYRDGVRVITSDVRRDIPQAKNTAFIARRQKLIDTFSDGIYEAILYSPDGDMLEGSGSNFFAVLDGKLRTASKDTMYGGVARSITLDACAQEPPLPIEQHPVHRDDLPVISEAMMCSVTRGVIPIVEIDGRPVGDGRPGPIFAELQRRYRAIHSAAMQDL